MSARFVAYPRRPRLHVVRRLGLSRSAPRRRSDLRAEVGPLDPAAYAPKESRTTRTPPWRSGRARTTSERRTRVAAHAIKSAWWTGPAPSRGGTSPRSAPTSGVRSGRWMSSARSGRSRSRWYRVFRAPGRGPRPASRALYGLTCDARLAILDGDAPRAIDRMRLARGNPARASFRIDARSRAPRHRNGDARGDGSAGLLAARS